MNTAWSWFFAKMIVLPSRSPPATFSPCVIRCSSTLSTVSALNSHLLIAAGSTRSGIVPSSSHSSASHASFSSSVSRRSGCLALELQRHRDRPRRYQKAVLYRLIEVVRVGRHTALQVEQRIGVAVDLVLGRGGQTDQQAVEIVEDRAVLPIDRTVRLVDHDQIEMADAEAALAVRISSIRPIIVG